MSPQRSLSRALRLLGVALFFCLGICGCQNPIPAGYVLMPELPKWTVPANAAPVPWSELSAKVQELAPGAELKTSDATFSRVDHATVLRAVSWTLDVYKLRQRDRAKRGFVAESWDCDKFSKALSLALERMAADAGVQAQPLIARVFVWQLEPWSGVPAGGGHAVAAVATDRGVIVIEPQTGEWLPLEKYPNRAAVWRVTIGG